VCTSEFGSRELGLTFTAWFRFPTHKDPASPALVQLFTSRLYFLTLFQFKNQSIHCHGEALFFVSDRPNDTLSLQYSSSVSILYLKQFTLLISPEKITIVVQAAAISSLSKPLDRLINGDMREAQENCARMQDLKPEDFERICEFAYRGDYTTPTPIDINASESDGESLSSSIVTSRPIELALSHLSRGKTQTIGRCGDRSPGHDQEGTTGYQRLRSHFNSKSYLNLSLPGIHHDPTSNTSASQDFTSVSLAHVRIYAFAQQYMIAPLKALTLSKLHRTLKSFTLYISCHAAVMELVPFAYDNDYISDRAVSGKVDELREMVVEYTAMHTQNFRHCADHKRFLNEEGEHVGDLMEVFQEWRL
jgi:hypothetical protein